MLTGQSRLTPSDLSIDRFSQDRSGVRVRDLHSQLETADSAAKTRVDYLALRVCTLDLKAAAALVQRAHVKKHEADLYPEMAIHLKRRGITRTPDQWGDHLYDQLFTVRALLEDRAAEWDSLSAAARLALIRAVIKAPVRETLEPGALDIVDRPH